MVVGTRPPAGRSARWRARVALLRAQAARWRAQGRLAPGLTAVVAGLILLGLAGAVLGHLAVLDQFDRRVVIAVHRWVLRHPDCLPPLRIVARLGSPICQDVAAVTAAGVLLRRRRYQIAKLFCGMVIGGQGLWFATSRLVDRPRPVVPAPVAFGVGGSLPSGHTSVTAVVTGALVLAYAAALGRGPRMGGLALALGWIIAVGCSRVALGVHYPSDVLAGLAVGLLVVSVARFVRLELK